MKEKTYVVDLQARRVCFSMLQSITEDDFLMGKSPVDLEDKWEEEE